MSRVFLRFLQGFSRFYDKTVPFFSEMCYHQNNTFQPILDFQEVCL